jgi:hypothetical protein
MTSIAQPSVQSLLIEMRHCGQALATGTGFVAQAPRGPVLVTNWHNLAGRNPDSGQPLSTTGAVPDELVIVHNRAGHLGEWIPRTEPLFRNGRILWFEHPLHGQRVDIVALPLTALGDVELYPYDIAGGPPIVVGPADSVSVIGFPFGLQAGGSLAVWATGFVASEPEIDFNGLPLMLVDCRSRPGQSGSAVIAYRSGGAVPTVGGGTALYGAPVWRFLGVYSGRINEQSDLGLVWKATAVGELLASVT